jgi:hypothetical protein
MYFKVPDNEDIEMLVGEVARLSQPEPSIERFVEEVLAPILPTMPRGGPETTEAEQAFCEGVALVVNALRAAYASDETKYYWKTRALASEEAAVKVTDHQQDELRRLREERDGYKGYWCGFATWAQEYLDSGRWAGHSLVDGIRTELQERDSELTNLKRRVGRDNLADLLTICPYLKTAPQRTEKVSDWLANALLAELEE